MRNYKLSVTMFSKEGETVSGKARVRWGDSMKNIVFETTLEEKVGF